MTADLRLYTGSVRLVGRRGLRVVEVLGPRPAGARRPTDQQLLFDVNYGALPEPVGMCISAGDRRARFLIDNTPAGDAFVDHLTAVPDRPVRLARPYGVKGWWVRA